VDSFVPNEADEDGKHKLASGERPPVQSCEEKN
jgi:hypothetical protein